MDDDVLEKKDESRQSGPRQGRGAGCKKHIG